MFTSCLVEKCEFVLFLGVWFVIVFGIQLFVNWYLFSILWRGREAEAILILISVSNPSLPNVYGVCWWYFVCLLMAMLHVWLLLLACLVSGLVSVCMLVICAFIGVFLTIVFSFFTCIFCMVVSIILWYLCCSLLVLVFESVLVILILFIS